jgi:SNF2 family DNA or RNA helicase
MEKEMFTELSAEESLNATTAAAKSQKCLQMASGAAYTDPEDKSKWYVLHDEKIHALESIIEELNGEPLLVAYHFKSDLARLKKAFPKGRVFDKKASTEDAWNRGEIPLMFSHPASAGHGSNLQHGGRNIAFFTHDWNLENYEQIIERLGPTRQAQAGYNRVVNIFHIYAEDTVEEGVMERNETKASVQDTLRRAMVRRKNV